MWVTTRADGLDDPNHTKRGPILNLTDLLGGLLRTGFVLQLGALSGMFLIYYIYGGEGFFSHDLSGIKNEYRSNPAFLTSIATLSGIYLIGSIALMHFQISAADDTCWARGYRTGSKVMRMATFLDVLSAAFYFLFYLYMAKHYSSRWYEHFTEGGNEWLFLVFTRLLRGFSLGGYAVSTYLLEVYHDEGAGDTHGYINGFLFGLAAMSELLVIGAHGDKLAPIMLLLALLATSLWAIFFEPEVNYVSPALHETELTNEVEQQVERFARMPPQNPPAAEMSRARMTPGGHPMQQ